MPQQTIGSFNLAVPQSLADQGGADDLPILPLQRHNDDFDAILLPELTEQLGSCRAAFLPKWKFSPQATTRAWKRSASTFRTNSPGVRSRNSSKGGRKICRTPMRSRIYCLTSSVWISSPTGLGPPFPGGEKVNTQGISPCWRAACTRCGDHLGMSAVDAVKEAQRHCGGTLRQMCGQSI